MPRAKNPLSIRNKRQKFTADEVLSALKNQGQHIELAASKRARVVRERSELNTERLRAYVRPPSTPSTAYSWSIADIVSARDQQMLGNFKLAAYLSESMSTDDAIYTARDVRLCSIQSLDVRITPGRGPKADKIADEADALFGRTGIAVSHETLRSIRAHLADHGVAFACINWTARADGSRVDPVLSAWPIKWVRWHDLFGCYVTQVLEESPDDNGDPKNDNGLQSHDLFTNYRFQEPIIHGNGRWVVFSKSELTPHRVDAALLPSAMIWARHAFSNRDWVKGSGSHGNAKVIGELPEGAALSDEDGNLTAEAAAFLQLLTDIASQDAPVGIRPPGSKVDYMTNASRAWEVWAQLSASAERAAARVYLGTDGILGAQGGAPGVDIQSLFGVATSKVQSDLRCVERALQTGLIGPWAMWNFGDDKQIPQRSYVFPDPDEVATREDFAKRNQAFLADVKGYRDNGFVLDQATVDAIAERHGVPAPKLPVAQDGGAATSNAAPIFAYHIQSGVVTINEVRAQLGLPPIAGGDVPATQANPTGDAAPSDTAAAPSA